MLLMNWGFVMPNVNIELFIIGNKHNIEEIIHFLRSGPV